MDDPHWQALEPPQRRQRTLEACARLLLRVSQVQPVLVVVENLHWIDTETQAFLDRLVDSLPFLPPFAPRGLSVPTITMAGAVRSSYTQLRLDPLPPESAEALAAWAPWRSPDPQAAHPAPHRAHGG